MIEIFQDLQIKERINDTQITNENSFYDDFKQNYQ
jgi:hypothetical protein